MAGMEMTPERWDSTTRYLRQVFGVCGNEWSPDDGTAASRRDQPELHLRGPGHGPRHLALVVDRRMPEGRCAVRHLDAPCRAGTRRRPTCQRPTDPAPAHPGNRPDQPLQHGAVRGDALTIATPANRHGNGL